MSATGRSSVRDPLDAYDTPKWCIRLLMREAKREFVEAVGLKAPWLEPCVGAGNIVRVTAEYFPDVAFHAIDIKPRLTDVPHNVTYVGEFDFFDWKPKRRDYTMSPSNPPYKFAKEFIEKNLQISERVIYLLRLNFFGSQKRNEWWRGGMMPVRAHVLPERPAFRPNKDGKIGTDACEYAWFVWERARQGRVYSTSLSVLPLPHPDDRRP